MQLWVRNRARLPLLELVQLRSHLLIRYGRVKATTFIVVKSGRLEVWHGIHSHWGLQRDINLLLNRRSLIFVLRVQDVIIFLA